jgi:hypothetical protein
VYPGTVIEYRSRADADKHADMDNRIACVKATEGQFDE